MWCTLRFLANRVLQLQTLNCNLVHELLGRIVLLNVTCVRRNSTNFRTKIPRFLFLIEVCVHDQHVVVHIASVVDWEIPLQQYHTPCWRLPLHRDIRKVRRWHPLSSRCSGLGGCSNQLPSVACGPSWREWDFWRTYGKGPWLLLLFPPNVHGGRLLGVGTLPWRTFPVEWRPYTAAARIRIRCTGPDLHWHRHSLIGCSSHKPGAWTQRRPRGALTTESAAFPRLGPCCEQPPERVFHTSIPSSCWSRTIESSRSPL